MKKIKLFLILVILSVTFVGCSAVIENGKFVVDIVKENYSDSRTFYSIIYSDGTKSSFSIKDGEKGDSDKVEIINGYWYINSKNTNIKASGSNGLNGKDGSAGVDGKDGKDGVSITSIELHDTVGNKDVYRINFSNGNYHDFEVSNARDVEFVILDDKLQYRYSGSEEYTELLSLSAIYQTVSENIKNVELSVRNGTLVWSYVGEDTYYDIIALSDLVGKDGKAGADGIDGKDGKAGVDGKDGREVELRIENGFIVWSYANEETTHNLIEISSLIGSDGVDGKDGKAGADGKDGREVELRIENGFIVWNYANDETTHNLIEISSLIGSDGVDGKAGADGIDGREIELQTGDGYITWNYVGEEESHNLIEIATLVGEKGDSGLSAYEIYLKYHPLYSKGEEAWIDDLVNGRLKDEGECNHTYTYNLIKEASEDEKGYAKLICEKCGNVSYLIYPKTPVYTAVLDDSENMIYQLNYNSTGAYISLKVNDKYGNELDLALHTEYKVLATPTKVNTGKISYQAEFNGEIIQIDYNVDKVPNYDWCWAFYNDFDRDGIPELLPTTYTNKTVYTYLYKIKESDLEGYPNVDEFGFSTDEEWDYVFSEEERLYNETVSPLENEYGFGDPKTQEAYDAYCIAIDGLYEALYEKDEKAQELFDVALKEFRDTHDTSMVGTISERSTFTLEETNTLAYWLHIPFDYDETKSYPLVVFSPGEGGSFSDYVDSEGNVKGTKVIPYGADWCNAWFSSWYSQVKEPGEAREKYDCFMISIYPTNKFFRGEYLAEHGTAIGINAMHNVEGLTDAYTYSKEQLEGSSATYKSCYDSSLLEPAKDAQLVIQLIDDMAKIYNIDLKRQYMLGASLGGILTMDTILHYPDRFAAAIPVVSASADISEKNCKYLVNMNIWAISGTGDGNCSRYHSKLFVNEINKCREKYAPDSTNVAQYSFLPGGHSCAYIGSTLRTATEGVSITYSTQVLDFLFNSSK